MNRYLSLVYLYCRASGKKLAVMILMIPLLMAAVYAVQGDLDGVLPVLVIIGACFLFQTILLRSLRGGGYTIRRLLISPLGAYFTVLAFCLIMMIIFWAAAVASLGVMGSTGTELALMILRTKAGHALLPVGHGSVMVFDVLIIAALAGECARSCYLGWHNGRQSAGIILILAVMFYVWCCSPEDSFTALAIMFTALYGACVTGDVIFREKRPKGDFFIVNKYTGIMDMDSDEFKEDVRLEANSLTEPAGDGSRPSLRQRLMPPGINMEKANYLLAGAMVLGLGENMIFFGRFMIGLQEVRLGKSSCMPYFDSLAEHSCLGYAAGILLVLILQMYWNYSYYNKETMSVYVMKRLPDSRMYPRSIWRAPALEALIIFALMLANVAADFLIYIVVTPDTALRPDFLQHVLPFIGG